MSLLNLTTETMVVQSERWLDPKRLRKSLTALPLIVPLMPVLQKVHDDLLTTQKVTTTTEKDLAAVSAEEARRDARHDRKVRGSYNYLGALAELTDDPEAAGALLDLRDRLVPLGPTAITRSYVDEAGDAKRLPARLDDASRKLLGKLQTPDGPLQVHVDAWVEEAQQLGVLEERREHLEKDLKGGAGGPTAADVLAARHAWIRAVRALESNLALEPKADAELVEKILGPLRRAEAKADRRKGASKGGPVDGSEDTLDLEPEGDATEKVEGQAGAKAEGQAGAKAEGQAGAKAGPKAGPKNGAKGETPGKQAPEPVVQPGTTDVQPEAKVSKPL